VHRFTSDPALAIDGYTSSYRVYNSWKDTPVLTVSPNQATIVQELRVYASEERWKKDPASYRLEGRKLPTDEWEIISEGDLPGISRNPANVLITESSNHGKAAFANTVSYNEYRVWFPTTRGSTGWQVVGDVQFGGFLVPNDNVQLTAPYPTGAFGCSSSPECESGQCTGEGICL